MFKSRQSNAGRLSISSTLPPQNPKVREIITHKDGMGRKFYLKVKVR
jgi:hypothetical protein